MGSKSKRPLKSAQSKQKKPLTKFRSKELKLDKSERDV